MKLKHHSFDSAANLCCHEFAYFQWVGGRELMIKTISAELDCAELGNFMR